MELEELVLDFQQRWNCQCSIIQAKEAFKYFRNRMFSTLISIVGMDLLKLDARYRLAWGAEPQLKEHPLAVLVKSYSNEIDYSSTQFYLAAISAESLPEFIFTFEVLFRLLEESEDVAETKIKEIAIALKKAIDQSPGIDFKLSQSGKRIITYPAGAKLLDQQVINQDLVWLSAYPTVVRHFEEALCIYMSKDNGKYRNLLDNLRFALEQLIKEILGNDKSLDNQKELILKWLSERQVHQQVINMYQDILTRFTQYQNDAVKHNEAWSEPEVEFMIYLTGTFMRLLLQLNQANPIDDSKAAG